MSLHAELLKQAHFLARKEPKKPTANSDDIAPRIPDDMLRATYRPESLVQCERTLQPTQANLRRSVST